MSNNQRLQDDVKAFVRKTITSLNIDWSDEDGRIDPICQVLRIITDEFTVEKYDFTLAMDVFVETAPKELSLCLEEILSLAEADADYDAKEKVYFAAYYALSLIYKKEDNQEGLLSLTSANMTFLETLLYISRCIPDILSELTILRKRFPVTNLPSMCLAAEGSRT